MSELGRKQGARNIMQGSGKRLSLEEVKALKKRLLTKDYKTYSALAIEYGVTDKAIYYYRNQISKAERAKQMRPFVIQRALQISETNSVIVAQHQIQHELLVEMQKETDKEKLGILLSKLKMVNECIETSITVRNSACEFGNTGQNQSTMSPQQAEALVAGMSREAKEEALRVSKQLVTK